MMGVHATFGVAADAVDSLQRFVDVCFSVYVLCIFAYVLTSWIRLPYSPVLSKIQRFLYDVCEPYLRLFRRIIPSFGPIDISPMIAIFVLVIVWRLVNSLLGRA